MPPSQPSRQPSRHPCPSDAATILIEVPGTRLRFVSA